MAEQNAKIRVLIADDHSLFRNGLRKILELENDIAVCGEAKNGKEVVEKVNLLKPDVVLLDINMPLLSGVDATKEIKQKYDEVKIVILTIHADEEYLFETVKGGASGFLLKDVETPTLLQAIREVSEGKSFIHPSITPKLLGEFNRLATKSKDTGTEVTDYELTTREKEILELMAKGYTNKKISKNLYISEKTVKNHVSNVLRKLDVSDRTQAVVTAVKLGLVDIE
ncbi:response regulator [Natranaerofaba carboxydovora]|uniref:response regulator n=1 Tax=Natranaerofaba carboxydovora TaxID=2742683 RepID=UPI001F142268|nr:response regulator transcription factor [Natranaerofaba carboxydovora]UMZ75043.1 Transcriptional regulatory protein DegU [Natranaerofaba carboxydovora]